MVGTRLGHLGGLLGRKNYAPCLLLPTVVPSFDCEAMNNAWRMGLKEGEGWRSVGGDLNLKGALPQWESLPMNNHTDEPRRKRERERDGG